MSASVTDRTFIDSPAIVVDFGKPREALDHTRYLSVGTTYSFDCVKHVAHAQWARVGFTEHSDDIGAPLRSKADLLSETDPITRVDPAIVAAALDRFCSL